MAWLREGFFFFFLSRYEGDFRAEKETSRQNSRMDMARVIDERGKTSKV